MSGQSTSASSAPRNVTTILKDQELFASLHPHLSAEPFTELGELTVIVLIIGADIAHERGRRAWHERHPPLPHRSADRAIHVRYRTASNGHAQAETITCASQPGDSPSCVPPGQRPESCSETCCQGRGRTADLPLFRRLCRSRSVHHRPTDQVIRGAACPWRPGSAPHIHSRR